MKYWLDIDSFNEDRFFLRYVDKDIENDIVMTGSFSSIGITDGDGNWTNKLDDYFESFGIHPDDWEVG